jgi:ATP-dependent Clp protease ATP-binding subunit ClpA
MENKKRSDKSLPLTVTEDDITEVVASWTNIPVTKLSEDETKD